MVYTRGRRAKKRLRVTPEVADRHVWLPIRIRFLLQKLKLTHINI